MFLFPILETDERGRVLTDNRGQVFTRKIHPSEVDLRKYIANRDEYLYYNITSQAEREFDTILHQDCLRQQDEAWKAHFFEHGLPGYQPFLLQDGAFSTRSGETNYRYQCMSRIVHPVSTSRCYNKLPVVLWLPQHLVADAVLNFSDSATYFLDPDSRLLSPITSEVTCSALFPAIYQTLQGWIAVTPDIHQAPPPKPLPVSPPRRTEDVFQEQNCNEGGLYQPDSLDAMQDLLLTPLLREAVMYKLAHQVHNLRPENEHTLSPLDAFPVDAAAAGDWRNLLFGGWWSWLEKWGKLASIFIGAYYLYVAGRWLVTTLFSLKVLYDEHGFGPNLLCGLGPGQDVLPMRFYQRWRRFKLVTTLFSLKVLYDEHGFGPNLLWGLGPGQGVFSMRFYRRWRRFKQHLSQADGWEAAQAPSITTPHEYLALNEVEMLLLPRRNLVRSSVYPELPPLKHTPGDTDGHSTANYARPERRPTAGETLPCQQLPGADVSSQSRPSPTAVATAEDLVRTTPPATVAQPVTVLSTSVASAGTEGLVGLPNPRLSGIFRPPEDTFLNGPIREVMKPHPLGQPTSPRAGDVLWRETRKGT